jgi:hypothetical protein
MRPMPQPPAPPPPPHGFVGWLRSLSFPARWATVGALALGLLGAVAGLAIGLHIDVNTAWFGIFELGIPATIVGGGFGFIAGGIVAVGHRVQRNH